MNVVAQRHETSGGGTESRKPQAARSLSPEENAVASRCRQHANIGQRTRRRGIKIKGPRLLCATRFRSATRQVLRQPATSGAAIGRAQPTRAGAARALNSLANLLHLGQRKQVCSYTLGAGACSGAAWRTRKGRKTTLSEASLAKRIRQTHGWSQTSIKMGLFARWRAGTVCGIEQARRSRTLPIPCGRCALGAARQSFSIWARTQSRPTAPLNPVDMVPPCSVRMSATTESKSFPSRLFVKGVVSSFKRWVATFRTAHRGRQQDSAVEDAG